MVDVARRNLFQEKLRFVISSGGVALAIMLILILNGFFAGMNRQVTAYLSNTPVSLLVAEKGIRNFLGTNSSLPLSEMAKIERVEGVEKVIPVIASYVVLDIEGKKVFTLMIGYDRSKGGGPWEIAEGGSIIDNDEVIYDETAADKNGLKVGDNLRILGKDFKIAGLSGGTSSWMTGTVFITFDAASALRQAKGRTSFFLVSTEPDADANAVGREIGRVAGLSMTPKAQVEANDISLFVGVFSGPLRFMVVVSFLIGLMLVGLTIYTATVERAKEYGVLKAIGTRNKRLYLIVFEQALIASLVGSAFGVLLGFIAANAIMGLRPQFFIFIGWSFVALVLPIALLIGVLAAYIPVRTVARIDPAIAFRRGA